MNENWGNDMKSLMTAIIAGATVLGGLVPARGQSPQEFYKANGLRIIVGFGAGGGYDVYSRTLARHIGRHIPGNPNVIVQNMPGAGSMIAANYIYVQAKKDGSTIATMSRGLPFQPLIDRRGVQFDPLKMEWIGSPSTEVSVVFAMADKGFKSFADLTKKDFTTAASGTGADSAIYPYVMNALLGTRFRVITGYRGSADFFLAIERGEADGSGGSSISTIRSTRPLWAKDNRIDVLVQLALKKHPDYPGVPLITELAKNEADRQTLELIFARQTIAYPFAAPPGTPADRLAVLRSAMARTVADKAYVADATKQGLEVGHVSGDEILSLLKRAYANKPEVVERIRSAIAEGIKASRKRTK